MANNQQLTSHFKPHRRPPPPLPPVCSCAQPSRLADRLNLIEGLRTSRDRWTLWSCH